MNTAPGRPGPAELIELDLLRGIAAVLMIVNHAGNELLAPGFAHTGPGAIAVFLGSFAPVVFFFGTGFGVAVASVASGRPPQMRSVFLKAVLLFLADQLAYWRFGVPLGLDFLGFIAIAMLLAAWVATAPRRFGIACAIIVAVTLLRFGLGPRIADVWRGALIDWVIGVHGVSGTSYAFGPWIVLPMLGLAIGLRYPVQAGAASAARRRWLRSSLLAAVLLFGLSAVAFVTGASFYRWSTMGLGFFALSLAMAAALGAASMATAAAWPPAARRLGLRGVASFAVVPIHYAAIEVAKALLGEPLAPAAFFGVAAMLAILSIGLSSYFAELTRKLAAFGGTGVALAILGMVGVCVMGMALLPLHEARTRLALMVIGQLGVAGLLGLRASRRAQQAVQPAIP